MALAAQLQATYDGFHSSVPQHFSDLIKGTTSDFKESYRPESAIKVGAAFPGFRLQDARGKETTNADLHGATLFAFYRGGWCPYCNLELAALQRHLPAFQAKGVNLVAISPELPDTSLSTTEKNELQFTVLSDVGNKLAKQMGILFPMPESMRALFDANGLDMKARNGDDSLEVPVPASFLVDEHGVIRNAFVDADYTKRLEPETALGWIDALQGKVA